MAQKANSTADARPNRQTIETIESTGPSCKVIAYQVVPQIRAQMTMAAIVKGRLKVDLRRQTGPLIIAKPAAPLTSCAGV